MNEKATNQRIRLITRYDWPSNTWTATLFILSPQGIILAFDAAKYTHLHHALSVLQPMIESLYSVEVQEVPPTFNPFIRQE